MIKVGVIGFGYWGPNIVRNFNSIREAQVACVCDIAQDNLDKAKTLYPHMETTRDHMEIMTREDIDAVAIITPVSTHFELSKTALEHNKHIFVEKPFTTRSSQARELIDLAREKNLKIMVDHTFLYTGAVQKIKEMIDDGALGDINYYDSTRVSLGLFQHDVNVIWDLAPHDFSIINYLTGKQPVTLCAHGMDHVGNGYENIAYITMYYKDKLIAHLNVNWLSPVKVRSTLIGGSKKMLVWDDLQADEKIKIYDKGIDVNSKAGVYQLKVEYRSGDMYSPMIEHTEALKKECLAFVDHIENGTPIINDGEAGLRVVRMLECADESLKNDGKLISL